MYKDLTSYGGSIRMKTKYGVLDFHGDRLRREQGLPIVMIRPTHVFLDPSRPRYGAD